MNMQKAGSRAKALTWPRPLEISGLRMTAMYLEQAAHRTLDKRLFAPAGKRDAYEALLEEQRGLLADVLRELRRRNK